MIVKEARFDVKLISHQALAGYMDHRDFTVRGLADAATVHLKRKRSKATVSRSTVGHLRSGQRSTCGTDVAKAIEDVLGAPRGSLFVGQVSTVSRERKRAA